MASERRTSGRTALGLSTENGVGTGTPILTCAVWILEIARWDNHERHCAREDVGASDA